MDAARHEKSEQKTESRYKRRCGGKDGRGVQEKTAARNADTRDQRDMTWHENSEQKTEYGYKRRCGGKDRRGVQEKTAAARGRSGRAAGVGGESSFRSKICSNC